LDQNWVAAMGSRQLQQKFGNVATLMNLHVWASMVIVPCLHARWVSDWDFFLLSFPIYLQSVYIHLNTISKLCVEKRERVDECSVAPLRDKRVKTLCGCRVRLRHVCRHVVECDYRWISDWWLDVMAQLVWQGTTLRQSDLPLRLRSRTLSGLSYQLLTAAADNKLTPAII
jgi:hypothetical protein